MSNKPSIDLKSEVEKIMFLADDDVITMSEDSSKFAAVMSVLTVYERQVILIDNVHVPDYMSFYTLRGM